MEKEMGKRIKAYMEAAGMSQSDLAAAVGVGTTSVSNWVNGTKVPRMDKVDAMCAIFGCRRSDLLDVTYPTATPGGMIVAELRVPYGDKSAMLAAEIRSLSDEDQKAVEDMVKRLKAYSEALKGDKNEN